MIYGIHAVQSLVRVRPESILRVYLSKDSRSSRLRFLLALLEDSRVPVRMVDRRWIDQRAGSDSVHQGVLACARKISHPREDGLIGLLSCRVDHLLLVLDRVTDPHNLGACLRCAAAAGVHAVVLPRDGSVGLGAVVRKVASGAVEDVRLFRVSSLVQTLGLVRRRGTRVIGTVVGARCLYRSDLTGPVALVLGSEGSGLRGVVRACCDELIGIPTSGAVSSLNVSVVAGICLFEILRQRSRVGS